MPQPAVPHVDIDDAGCLNGYVPFTEGFPYCIVSCCCNGPVVLLLAGVAILSGWRMPGRRVPTPAASTTTPHDRRIRRSIGILLAGNAEAPLGSRVATRNISRRSCLS